jgi:hypothetical protein
LLDSELETSSCEAESAEAENVGKERHFSCDLIN